MRPTARLTLALAAVVLAAPSVRAHDVAQTGATVVVREGGHASLQLNLTWSRILHARARPTRPLQEYLAFVTMQPPAEFARVVREVQQLVERDVLVQRATGAPQPFAHWEWPSPATIQGALQRELMSLMVEGASEHHASRLATTAELRFPSSSPEFRVRFPAVLGAVLLTVSAPSESWLKATEWSRPFRTTARP